MWARAPADPPEWPAPGGAAVCPLPVPFPAVRKSAEGQNPLLRHPNVRPTSTNPWSWRFISPFLRKLQTGQLVTRKEMQSKVIK